MTEANSITLAKKRYEALQSPNEIDNFYGYEKELETMWREFGWEALEANVSNLPVDRSKKTLTKFGKVGINKAHCFSEGANGFR